jgi:PAS domain S-box-containing protein
MHIFRPVADSLKEGSLAMIFSALINNITLIISLSILYHFIVRRWKQGSRTGQAVSGLLFGAVAIAGMMNPLIFSPGLIFDGRSIVISIAGFIGGWVTALIAALMGVLYRVWLGGPGAVMGVSVIAASAAVGVAYRYIRRRSPCPATPLHLLGFGIIVHLCMLAMTMTLPSGTRYEVFSSIAIPVMLIYPLGTLLVGVVLLDLESRIRAEDALRESEERYRNLFNNNHTVMLIVDPDDASIKDANAAACSYYGWSREELMQRKIEEINSLTREEVSAEMQLARTERRNHFFFKHRRADGTIRDVDVYSGPIMMGGRTLLYSIVHDITERRRAEDGLWESEGKFRTIIENIEDGYYEVDIRGNLTFLNEAACRTMGYEREELLGMNNRRYADGENARKVYQVYKQVYLTGQPVKNFEWQMIRKDGARRDVELSISLIRDREGRPTGFRGIVRDVTDRKRAEEEKHRSREEAVRSADEMVIIAEIGRVVGSSLDINQVFERVATETRKLIPYDRILVNLKKTPGDEFLVVYASGVDNPGRRVMDSHPSQGTATGAAMRTRAGILIQPTDAEEIRDLYPNLHETFKAGLRSTMTVPLISMGEVIGAMTFRSKKLKAYTERDLRLVEKIGAQVAGAIANAQLFNDLNKTEKSLRESNELFSLFMRHSPIYAFIKEVTPDRSTVLQASENYQQMIGIPGSEMAGKSMVELFPPEFGAKITADDWAVVSRGEVLRLDEELNGRSYTTIKFPIVRGDRNLLAGYTIDITERRQAEDEKRVLEERLQHADKMEAIGTLAGGIAHDFNNLLMGIQGYASLALMNLDLSHPNYERLKRIEEHVQSGADLTKQLLGFARGGRYDVKPADMNDILQKSSSMFGRAKKEIFIHRKYGKDLWTAEVDRGQMEQMFMNLYVNAWQAMPGGGEIYLETENVNFDDAQAFSYSVTAGKYVKISVTDTGIGMDEKTRVRIFDPFFTTKGMGRGTGLGLATVYGIIKGHKGMITVYSEPGHGTTFNIYLPASEKEVAKEKKATTTIAKGTETILLVDDEKMVLEVNKEMLEFLGYRIYAAGSGQEAIAVYMEKGREVDLVILDMVMPGISGGETFDRLRKIDPDVKVLLSSGYSITGEARTIMGRGCNGFIQKPFQLEKLSGKIRNMLD